MKRLKLAIHMAILVLISSALAQGGGYQPYPSDGSQMSESIFYTTSAPSAPGSLVMVSQGMSYYPAVSQQVMPGNSLLIVDPNGLYRRTSLSIPLSQWAREEVLPGMDGYLTMHERYPSGIVRSYNLGYVYAGCRYMVWFRADIRGTHEVWYTVNGLESNHISFYVYRQEVYRQEVYRQEIVPYAPTYVTKYVTPIYYTKQYTKPKPLPKPNPNPYSVVGTSTGARASY